MKLRTFQFPMAIALLLTIAFTLSFCTEEETEPTNAIKDVDGNVYTSVTIGTQVWMVENLKTTRYRNGDPIPNVTDQTAWGELTSGGYCNQSNEAATVGVYGRLYNWYAVNDNRNIAPVGWHIATDEEWTTLTDYLGGEEIAGAKLKEKGSSHWCNPNSGATNTSGFTALPGGVRTEDMFLPGCEWGLWWTSTEKEISTGYNRIIFDNDVVINRVDNNKASGMSVRCIKD